MESKFFFSKKFEKQMDESIILRKLLDLLVQQDLEKNCSADYVVLQ